MTPVTRRDAVKLAAGLAAGAATAGPAGAYAADPVAFDALSWSMFSEQVTFKTSTTDPHTFNLVIGPARASEGGGEVVVRPGTARVFQDESAKPGGLTWRCGAARGTIEFKRPGGLVLAVRDQDGTVRCYTLDPDLRC